MLITLEMQFLMLIQITQKQPYLCFNKYFVSGRLQSNKKITIKIERNKMKKKKRRKREKKGKFAVKDK